LVIEAHLLWFVVFTSLHMIVSQRVLTVSALLYFLFQQVLEATSESVCGLS
jgi:hypothetical protein